MLKSRFVDRNGAGVLMFVMDVVAIAVVTAIARAWSLPVLVFAVVLLIVFYGKSMYRSRAALSVLDDFPGIFGGAAIAAAFGFAIALDVVDTLSVKTVLIFLSYVLALSLGRLVAYFLIHRLRRRGILQRRVVIVGTGVVAEQLALAANNTPEGGFLVVGFVDEESSGHESPPVVLGPIVGRPDQINQIIIDERIDHVIVAYSAVREADLVTMIRTADHRSCEISMVERFFEVTARGQGDDEVSGIPLVLLRRRAYRTLQWRVKRLIDIAVSAAALIVLSPLLLTIALISRIKDGPGVIFRQERISLDGDPFEIMKFRSLRPANEAESATKWNVKNDDRMSGFGRFIRKTSIDELPQLINILKGDMSLVGPRPERPHFVEEFGSQYRNYDDRHRVPSGLTGWAQVNGLRGDTSIEERARYDNYYIQNWSLWLDIKIMLRTTLSLTKAAG